MKNLTPAQNQTLTPCPLTKALKNLTQMSPLMTRAAIVCNMKVNFIEMSNF